MPLPVRHSTRCDDRVVNENSCNEIGRIVDVALTVPLCCRIVGFIVHRIGGVHTKEDTDSVTYTAKAISENVVFVHGVKRLTAYVSASFDCSKAKPLLLTKPGSVISRGCASCI